MRTIDGLLDDLVDEGILSFSDRHNVQTNTHRLSHRQLFLQTPVYLQAFVGFSAWLATLFFIGCFGAISGLDDSTWAVIGLPLLGGASVVRRTPLHQGEQLAYPSALAVAMTGASLLFAGIVSPLNPSASSPGIYITSILVAGLVIAVFPDPLMRLIATLVAAGSLLVGALEVVDAAAFDALVPVLYAAALFGHLRRRALHHSPAAPFQGPVAMGLTLATLCALTKVFFLPKQIDLGIVCGVGLTVVTAGLVDHICRQYELRPGHGTWNAAVLGVLALGLTSTVSPGLMASVGFAAAGWYQRDRTLTALAAVFVVGYGIWLYYALAWPFPLKAAAMAGAGTLFLVARQWLRHQEAP